jgi:hypothetical protein
MFGCPLLLSKTCTQLIELIDADMLVLPCCVATATQACIALKQLANHTWHIKSHHCTSSTQATSQCTQLQQLTCCACFSSAQRVLSSAITLS